MVDSTAVDIAELEAEMDTVDLVLNKHYKIVETPKGWKALLLKPYEFQCFVWYRVRLDAVPLKEADSFNSYTNIETLWEEEKGWFHPPEGTDPQSYKPVHWVKFQLENSETFGEGKAIVKIERRSK